MRRLEAVSRSRTVYVVEVQEGHLRRKKQCQGHMSSRSQGTKVFCKEELPGDLSLENSRHWWG